MSERLGLFTYDMTATAPRQQVLRQLRSRRVTGQLSLHACHLLAAEAPPLFHQLTTAITPQTDRLLFTWVDGMRPVLVRGRTAIDSTAAGLLYLG